MLKRKRRCKAANKRGEPCGFPPLTDSELCWAHDPENEEAAQEARRLGGVRRKRETTLAGAYEFGGILADGGLARYIEIAAFDSLALDAGHAKIRTMVAVAQVAEKVLKTEELERRLAELEEILRDQIKEASKR
jgi:hypothetical protein